MISQTSHTRKHAFMHSAIPSVFLNEVCNFSVSQETAHS